MFTMDPEPVFSEETWIYGGLVLLGAFTVCSASYETVSDRVFWWMVKRGQVTCPLCGGQGFTLRRIPRIVKPAGVIQIPCRCGA